jgi:hypothetical protein
MSKMMVEGGEEGAESMDGIRPRPHVSRLQLPLFVNLQMGKWENKNDNKERRWKIFF